MTVPEETIINIGKKLKKRWLQKNFKSKMKIKCGRKDVKKEKVYYRKRSQRKNRN